jgi:hypothetical protein
MRNDRRSRHGFATHVCELSIWLSACAAASCAGSSTGPSANNSDFVQVSGRVFSTVSYVGACAIAPGVPSAPVECYSGPVAGAVVSTSIDATTATTDAAGRFLLTTNTLKKNFGGCQPYTLTITAAGHPTYSVTGPHGTGGGTGDQLYRQLISLSPPEPSRVNACPG